MTLDEHMFDIAIIKSRFLHRQITVKALIHRNRHNKQSDNRNYKFTFCHVYSFFNKTQNAVRNYRSI